tara:strand:- start:523 stop:774 length:252 start_codon:yes stop_codon:yes gene_type:complete
MALKPATTIRSEMLTGVKSFLEFRINQAKSQDDTEVSIAVNPGMLDADFEEVLTWLDNRGYEYDWLDNGRFLVYWGDFDTDGE